MKIRNNTYFKLKNHCRNVVLTVIGGNRRADPEIDDVNNM